MISNWIQFDVRSPLPLNAVSTAIPKTDSPTPSIAALQTFCAAPAMNGTTSSGNGAYISTKNEKTSRNAMRVARLQRGASSRSDTADAAIGSGSAKLDADILCLRKKPQRFESTLT